MQKIIALAIPALVLLAAALFSLDGRSARTPAPARETQLQAESIAIEVSPPDAPEGTSNNNALGENSRPSPGNLEARKKDGDLSAAERQLVQKDGMSLNNARKILESESFGDYLLSLKRQTSTDQDAQDLTKAYRSLMDKALLGNQGTLVDFACGTSFCAGSAVFQGKKASPSIHALFGERPPVYGVAGKSFSIDGHSYEYRFVFSTDPQFKKLFLNTR